MYYRLQLEYAIIHLNKYFFIVKRMSVNYIFKHYTVLRHFIRFFFNTYKISLKRRINVLKYL